MALTRHVDATLITYLLASISVALNYRARHRRPRRLRHRNLLLRRPPRRRHLPHHPPPLHSSVGGVTGTVGANAYRRVDHTETIKFSTFTMLSPVLVVPPFTHPDNYWQVYFDGNRIIRESFAAAGFPAPETQYVVTQRT